MSQMFGLIRNRRILALGALTIAIAGLLLLTMNVLSRPVYQTLYSGLDAEDVNRIGAVLNEVGISFDINEAANAVLVDPARSAQARMILAEKGLPKSDKSGYELFDQMGSLGLTTFMQQVTRVRALEGELVRTIQQLDGVKSARVHLALRSEGSLRSRDAGATASVVLRFDGEPAGALAQTVRQIVAAAIPGLKAEDVSVSTTEGRVLASAGEQESAEPNSMLDLETKIASEMRSRVERTLAPVVGLDNLRVSVSAAINLDKSQTQVTDFDPESKVERSMRTVKSSDQTSEGDSTRSVSADQNIPREVTDQSSGGGTSKMRDSKEETVNYELNSKKIDTQSSGYRITRLSAAVVINRGALTNDKGEPIDDAAVKARLAEIEGLVRSAAGIDESRKDSLTVSALQFVKLEISDVDAAPAGGMLDSLTAQLGTIINAAGMILAVVLIIFLGLRPGLKMIASQSIVTAIARPPEVKEIESRSPATAGLERHSPGIALEGLPEHRGGPTSIDKLNRIVGIDVDRAAQVLKSWIQETLKEAA
jgi:flagellar M-ring protein FliF